MGRAGEIPSPVPTCSSPCLSVLSCPGLSLPALVCSHSLAPALPFLCPRLFVAAPCAPSRPFLLLPAPASRRCAGNAALLKSPRLRRGISIRAKPWDTGHVARHVSMLRHEGRDCRLPAVNGFMRSLGVGCSPARSFFSRLRMYFSAVFAFSAVSLHHISPTPAVRPRTDTFRSLAFRKSSARFRFCGLP